MSDFFSVLFIGGTGAISHSCVAEALKQGMAVTVVNRGQSSRLRPDAPTAETLVADVNDAASVARALGQRHFDAAANFVSFSGADARRDIELFGPHVSHYVHISSASVYHRPLPKPPLGESTLPWNQEYEYMRGKVEAEQVFLGAFETQGFPVTIVRPAHTYDEAILPVPGSWAVADRIERGEPIVVPGDGTSLWTLTHAADLAVGLVGLLGRRTAFGESFHITGNDVLDWNQIYHAVGQALHKPPVLQHLPAELIKAATSDWFWAGLIDGDLSHSELYDSTKIRNYVPAFNPVKFFEREVYRIIAWRRDHPELARADAAEAATLARLAGAYATMKATLD